MKKRVIGITAVAAQQRVAAVAARRDSELRRLAASARSSGNRRRKVLRDASSEQMRCWADGEPAAMSFGSGAEDGVSLNVTDVDIVLSPPVEADIVRGLERQYAATTAVLRVYRYKGDIVLISRKTRTSMAENSMPAAEFFVEKTIP